MVGAVLIGYRFAGWGFDLHRFVCSRHGAAAMFAIFSKKICVGIPGEDDRKCSGCWVWRFNQGPAAETWSKRQKFTKRHDIGWIGIEVVLLLLTDCNWVVSGVR